MPQRLTARLGDSPFLCTAIIHPYPCRPEQPTGYFLIGRKWERPATALTKSANAPAAYFNVDAS